MLAYKKTCIVCLVVFMLLMSPLSVLAAHDEDVIKLKKRSPDQGAIVADLVIARPLGLVATIAGSVVFIVAAPFAALGDNTDETLQSLVKNPAEYTFKRPIGRFDE